MGDCNYNIVCFGCDNRKIYEKRIVIFCNNKRFCFTTFIIDKSIGFDISKLSEAIPSYEKYKVSNDNKWGVWVEQHEENKIDHIIVYHTVYLKNIETEEIKEIYTSERVITCVLFWTKDNELIMGSYKDREGKKDRFHVAVYNPTTQKVRVLVDFKNQYDHGFFYSESNNSLLYRDRIKGKDVYKVIHPDINKEESVSEEVYNKIMDEEFKRSKEERNK